MAENRRRVADALGLGPPERWAWLHQVHGARVVEAGRPWAEPPAADAAVTTRRDTALVVLTADCAPLVLASDAAVAVVHAGHRGLLAGVVERTIEAVERAGGPLRAALLGPCIRPDRYEFGADDLRPLVERFGAAVEQRTREGRPALDLPAAVHAALDRSGVDPAVLVDTGVCTAASADHFSYRRDGRTGRQATIAVLAP